MRTVLLSMAALLVGRVALAAEPAPEPSSWLTEAHDRLVEMARLSSLAVECGFLPPNVTRGVLVEVLLHHGEELPPGADRAYAERAFRTGQSAGIIAVEDNRAAACSGVGLASMLEATDRVFLDLPLFSAQARGEPAPAPIPIPIPAGALPLRSPSAQPATDIPPPGAPDLGRKQVDGAGIDQPYHRDLVRIERLAFLCGRELPDGPLRTRLTDGYESELRGLNPEDQALANRLGTVGQADAAAEIKANRMTACAQLSPVVMAKLRNLAAGLGSFFRPR